MALLTTSIVTLSSISQEDRAIPEVRISVAALPASRVEEKRASAKAMYSGTGRIFKMIFVIMPSVPSALVKS